MLTFWSVGPRRQMQQQLSGEPSTDSFLISLCNGSRKITSFYHKGISLNFRIWPNQEYTTYLWKKNFSNNLKEKNHPAKSFERTQKVYSTFIVKIEMDVTGTLYSFCLSFGFYRHDAFSLSIVPPSQLSFSIKALAFYQETLHPSCCYF